MRGLRERDTLRDTLRDLRERDTLRDLRERDTLKDTLRDSKGEGYLQGLARQTHGNSSSWAAAVFARTVLPSRLPRAKLLCNMPLSYHRSENKKSGLILRCQTGVPDFGPGRRGHAAE